MRRLILIALLLAAPSLVRADGDDIWPDDCYGLCNNPDCGQLPCYTGDCLATCQKAYIADSNLFYKCDDIWNCADWFACICKVLDRAAADDDSGDDASVSGFDPYGRHHSGCGVFGGPNVALFLAMTALGLAALALGRRAGKKG